MMIKSALKFLVFELIVEKLLTVPKVIKVIKVTYRIHRLVHNYFLRFVDKYEMRAYNEHMNNDSYVHINGG